jgi:hypothetical protein
MQERFCRETHIVSTRMGMYQQRKRWLECLDKIKASETVRSDFANKVKPRAVTVEIIYQEFERHKPVTDQVDSDLAIPGVIIREVSVDDGVTQKEFSLSFSEARKLVELLSEI